MVRADSRKISRALRYSRIHYFYNKIFSYKTFTFFGIGFHLFFHSLISRWQLELNLRSHNPSLIDWFGLFPLRSPLLRESFLLSFPPVTKMFQFSGFALSSLWIKEEVQGSFLIRKPPDQSLLPAPRSVSPVIASFLASGCQGIPHKPFLILN